MGRQSLRQIVTPLLLLIAGVFALSVDLPIARWLVDHRLRGDLRDIMEVAEAFGHGLGVMLVLIAIWTLHPPGRRALPKLVAASLGAGMVANGVKLIIARNRPRTFDLATYDNIWATFGSWLPALDISGDIQSFPSAHSATAVGFAVGLAACYPRGKWFFAVLAVLTCMSRMHVGAHYLSDVLVGSAIGFAVANFCLAAARHFETPKLLRIHENATNDKLREAA